ncbi:unknown protein [Spodoptera frugiperda multiple nucleopolyhedrovirus]|uniref:Sf7 n=1 Tax=Spodoptera frugiperda nuclear polyhedrosis virus TaxID=10455 RepID=A1YIZ8_NPVSF|nr:hypothetical protein SFMNPV_gp007 [Spodoptera frugiperda multiple nucleopolyhedrovirus]ABM45719.1 unknown protein [Spodoptera frugiperda multiple nucleopolyhedrovirus]ACA02564.1 unknown [Spodoptera frugiperda multiple nucleopolyhedrovirus]ADV91238.1 hypothetical protein Sf7 [Spodoptera frugiperda multiple nucleopolyhedrovirus]AFH58967.1 hypothetical protein Sf7 [Spodoptera frugiperda multiple nucleopolyhedrovirus]QED39920.1 hypothetical protein [Spodoptera frugiperda multiple nucleopolyhedr
MKAKIVVWAYIPSYRGCMMISSAITSVTYTTASHVRHSRSRTHGRCTRSVEVTAHATGARASGHVGHWCRVHAVVDRIRFKACASSTFLQCKKVP